MKNLFMWPLFAAALLAYSACNCPPIFPLEEDSLLSPFHVDTVIVDDGVLIRFNKPVDALSLIAQKTLLIENAQYTGYFELSQDHLDLFIPQCETYCNTPMQLCPFTLRLNGDLRDGLAIRSESGQALDGDDNGSDGGDFSRAVNDMFDCDRYSLRVTEPLNGSSTSFSPNSPQAGVLNITFSENMDTSSVIAGENVYLECTIDNTVRESGSITWLSRNRMRFTTESNLATLRARCLNGDFFIYNFIIKGTGPKPVKSVYGVSLDNAEDYRLTVFL